MVKSSLLVFVIDNFSFVLCCRPFWLEKFNALSGQFSALERELLNSGNLLKEFLLEPANVSQNPSVPLDSIPNILLRSKLAPEVIETVQVSKDKAEKTDVELPISVYSNTIRALQQKFSEIQEDLQRSAVEHASQLLADEIVASGTATPSKKVEEDFGVILENSVRWLYTGKQ